MKSSLDTMPMILLILSAAVVICLLLHVDAWWFILAYWVVLVAKNAKEAWKK